MARTVELHEEALAEAEAAARWYADRDPDVAEAFVAELRRSLATVGLSPDAWPIETGEIRRYSLKRFPFKLIYVTRAGSCLILAVAHRSRAPRYWSGRQ